MGHTVSSVANAIGSGFQNTISTPVANTANAIGSGFQNDISTPVANSANAIGTGGQNTANFFDNYLPTGVSKFAENAFSGWSMAPKPGPSPSSPSSPSAPKPSTPSTSSSTSSTVSPYTGPVDTTQVSNAISSMPGLIAGNTNSGLGSGYNNLSNILGGISGMSNQPKGASGVIGGIMGTDPYGTAIPLTNLPSTFAGNPSLGGVSPQTFQQILNNYINGQIAPTGYGTFDTGWRG